MLSHLAMRPEKRFKFQVSSFGPSQSKAPVEVTICLKARRMFETALPKPETRNLKRFSYFIKSINTLVSARTAVCSVGL